MELNWVMFLQPAANCQLITVTPPDGQHSADWEGIHGCGELIHRPILWKNKSGHVVDCCVSYRWRLASLRTLGGEGGGGAGDGAGALARCGAEWPGEDLQEPPRWRDEIFTFIQLQLHHFHSSRHRRRPCVLYHIHVCYLWQCESDEFKDGANLQSRKWLFEGGNDNGTKSELGKEKLTRLSV